ncbi:MAG: winged helix-turn-helix domain-containing protein [Anaerolineae bacterium]|nr:winged helix-turn-helix domain-containing protein [Anaerolineae bacterium]
MTTNRSWAAYSRSYRSKEMDTLAGWIRSGASGAVVGLTGAGKSNLLGFLCHRPEILQSYLAPWAGSVALVLVDLNNLPVSNLSSLYRLILRSFYEARPYLETDLRQAVTKLYEENRGVRDPFLSQSALRELLLLFQTHHVRVILVLDHFDHFCQVASPQLSDTLRGLRDSFKSTLCYLVGVRQEIAYLSDPTILSELYELLDSHVCWVGPLAETDARQLVADETHAVLTPPTENEIMHLLDLTGGYPSLLKAACNWWLTAPAKPAATDWASTLLAERSLQYRLAEIWGGLTQEEQLALAQLQKWQSRAASAAGQEKALARTFEGLAKQHRHALARLTAKGLCQQVDSGWRIVSELLAGYVAQAVGRGSGKIWLDEETEELYQGQNPLTDLAPLERAVLSFLVKHPRLRHTKTELIVHAWPEELRQQGVTDDSLYQVIAKLREKIEPNPAKPCYLVTWRGTRGGMLEGGYQFFAEGRPGR